MRASRLARATAALLCLSGCVHDNHAEWWLGDVAPDWHDCRAAQGTHAVLDLQESRSVPVVPFAWRGFRLFIVTEPRHLAPGTSLIIPSGEATAILCDLGHGAAGDAIADVTGTVEVIGRRGADVQVRINLKGDRGYWSLRSKQWFERQGRPHEPPRPVG